jgi:hypothetical protein
LPPSLAHGAGATPQPNRPCEGHDLYLIGACGSERACCRVGGRARRVDVVDQHHALWHRRRRLEGVPNVARAVGAWQSRLPPHDTGAPQERRLVELPALAELVRKPFGRVVPAT